MGDTPISVRGVAAIVAVCALACVGAASASGAQLAVVGDEESDSVFIVDTATNQVVGSPVEAGDGPASIAITPDGRYAYVADALGDTVAVIDTSTGRPLGEPIKVGEFPFGLAITPDGSRALVTDSTGEEVSVIDTQTRQLVAGIHLGTNPTGVAVTPDGKFAYVTEGSAGAVEVIDIATMEVVGGPIEVGERPAGVEFSPDGKTAYVADPGSNEVSAIDTTTQEVTSIPLRGETPRGIVVAPDGRKAFVVNLGSDSVAVIDTGTDEEIEEIPVGSRPQEVAIAATGKTVYVTESGPVLERVPQVQTIDVEAGEVVGAPIKIPGKFPAGIALTPDQSPTAAFAVPDVTAGVPATFSGAASTDPDGSVVAWNWTFGDDATASGVRAIHSYRAPGTYSARLTVVDDEGCGEEEVFTGRTAYCSGGAASVVHPVTVKSPPPAVVPPKTTAPPPNDFRIRRVVHNRRNGTVRVKVWLPSAGSVVLFGRKVHAVTRKTQGPRSMWLTIHARVELNKRLKRIHRAPVRIRITFTPDGGTPKTMHRSVTLQRAPRRRHHRH